MELENSIETIPPLIEPLLQNYKGAELRFQEKEKTLALEFDIGSGENQYKIAISLAADAPEKTIMVLEVATAEDPSILRIPDKIMRNIDILINDILLHIISALKIKNKAKVLEKGIICPTCKKLNDLDAKFCKECGYNFLENSQLTPRIPEKPTVSEDEIVLPRVPQKPVGEDISKSSSSNGLAIGTKEGHARTDEEIIDLLDKKYVLKYECELCDKKCQYKSTFIIILKDIQNLKDPFEKFDNFLHNKDIGVFSDYIYEFATTKMKKHPEISMDDLPVVAFCLFSILSWHILEKASKSIRLTFAEKVKHRINTRFKKDFPMSSIEDLSEIDIETSPPTIRTGTLHIEENRCPYCYTKFDERTLKLKIKGYKVRCPNCDYEY